jgi:acyl carrier protein
MCAPTVVDCVSKILKIEVARVQEDCSFAEYGVDSILAVSLVNLINERFGLRLQTTVLFDYNNVTQLARHLIAEHKPALAAHLKGKAAPKRWAGRGRTSRRRSAKPRVRAARIGCMGGCARRCTSGRLRRAMQPARAARPSNPACTAPIIAS